MTEEREVVVVTGGGPLSAAAVAAVPEGAFVVAADGGADHASAAGVQVDAVIGDLDSVSSSVLERLRVGGVPIERHPADKDLTDLELALVAARARRPPRIVVLGGDGGRLDHLVANVLVLGAAVPGPPIEAWFGPAHVQLAQPGRTVTVRGAVGSVVSLLALHGAVSGVQSRGLRWPLQGDDLAPGVARGMSNELVETQATVEVGAGTLVVLQP